MSSCCFYHIRDVVVFAGICLLLSPKLLQLLLLAADLIAVIAFETSTCAKLFGKGSYPVSSFLSLITTS